MIQCFFHLDFKKYLIKYHFVLFTHILYMSLLYILRKKCKQENLIKVLPKHFQSSYHDCIILNLKLYLNQWQLHSLPGIKVYPSRTHLLLLLSLQSLQFVFFEHLMYTFLESYFRYCHAPSVKCFAFFFLNSNLNCSDLGERWQGS